MAEGSRDETVADVVVVGGGGSGRAAAIEAAAAGAEVVLLEKNPALGGTTAWSVGSITATRTPHQQAAGIEDSPDEHFDDMPLFAGDLAKRDNIVLRRMLTENVPQTVTWLMSLGVEFFGPMPEPPPKKPRMHNVLPNSRAYIHHLAKEARRRGVNIRTGVRAEKLVTENGRVVGVAVEGGPIYRARRAVVLASGDYTASPELKAEYISDTAAKIAAVNPTSTGDGQSMALALGARIVNGDLTLGPEIRFLPPERQTLVKRLPPSRLLARFIKLSMKYMPDALLRPFIMGFLTTALAPARPLFDAGVLVDREGRRVVFGDEGPALGLADHPDMIGYVVLDAHAAQRFSAWPHFISTAPGVAYAYFSDYRRNRKDVFREGRSLAALAARIGVTAEALEAAVEEHNRSHREGEGIAAPPFYALGPMKTYIVIAEGGLAVDPDLRVLGPEDEPIPGLYAAGSTGQGGLLLEGHGHHLGWAFTSGRIAGRNAASEKA